MFREDPQDQQHDHEHHVPSVPPPPPQALPEPPRHSLPGQRSRNPYDLIATGNAILPETEEAEVNLALEEHRRLLAQQENNPDWDRVTTSDDLHAPPLRAELGLDNPADYYVDLLGRIRPASEIGDEVFDHDDYSEDSRP